MEASLLERTRMLQCYSRLIVGILWWKLRTVYLSSSCPEEAYRLFRSHWQWPATKGLSGHIFCRAALPLGHLQTVTAQPAGLVEQTTAAQRGTRAFSDRNHLLGLLCLVRLSGEHLCLKLGLYGAPLFLLSFHTEQHFSVIWSLALVPPPLSSIKIYPKEIFCTFYLIWVSP